MIFALLAAVGSAICYGVASVLQAIGARSTHDTGTVDPRLLGRLLANTPFLIGVLLDITGGVLQFLSLRTLPLFLVQATQAANLAVTAVVAVPVLGARLAGRNWWAVGGVCAGLVLLSASAGAENAREPSFGFRLALLAWVVLLTAVGMLAGRLGSARRRPAAEAARPGSGRRCARRPARAAGARAARSRVGPGSRAVRSRAAGSILGPRSSTLGAVAGLGFGLTALAARSLTNLAPAHLVRDPALYAAVGGGVVAFLFFATGLQRGSVTAVSAAVVVGETAIPAVVGILCARRPHPARLRAGRGRRLPPRRGRRARAVQVRRADRRDMRCRGTRCLR